MNVMLIVNDSFRRDHLGCYGNAWIETPDLDRFAQHAAVFEQCYTASYPTVPHRWDLSTGRFGFPFRGWQPLDSGDVTLAQILGQHDMHTQMIWDTPMLDMHDYNYTRGFQYIWNEIPVLVTFESNWEKAKTILEKIISLRAEHLTSAVEQQIKEATKKYLITYVHLTPIVYTSVKDSGVLLSIRNLCDARKRRTSEHDIWEDVLKEFAKTKEIEFAYPTTRFFDQHLEGPDAVTK